LAINVLTERAWKLTDESWIYVVRDPERAGRALVTVMVDDGDPEGNQVGFGQAG
jgi:hypothetical protein